MATPHDAFFRSTFGQTEHVLALLLHLLPSALASALDRTSLRAVKATTTGPNLRQHHADLLFQAEMAGVDEPVVFLLEHKSGPEEDLQRQLLRYVVHIATEWERAVPTLPHIVPVVVHHGRRPAFELSWRPPQGAQSVSACALELREFRPGLSVILGDISLLSEAELRCWPLTALGCLTLLCLRFVPLLGDEEALASLERWGDLVRTVEATRGGREAMETLSSYFLHVTDLPVERLAGTIAGIVHKPTEGSVMSTADKLKAEGKVEGRVEGKVEGRVEGRVDLLRRLLVARFGPLPTQFESRLRTGSIEELERWAIRILDARSLADVFADA